jgi:hypothetical protein
MKEPPLRHGKFIYSGREESHDVSLLFNSAVAFMTSGDTIDALALLAIAIGIAGIAILILFAKKKI